LWSQNRRSEERRNISVADSPHCHEFALSVLLKSSRFAIDQLMPKYGAGKLSPQVTAFSLRLPQTAVDLLSTFFN